MMLPGLRYERHVAGLSQEQLAEKSGVGRDTIQKLETGQRPARPATIKRLADALGVRTEELTQNKEGRNRMSEEQTIMVPEFYPDFENAETFRRFDGSTEAWLWDRLLSYKDQVIVESLARVLAESDKRTDADLPGIAETLWGFDREAAEEFVKAFGVEIADRANELTGLFED